MDTKTSVDIRDEIVGTDSCSEVGYMTIEQADKPITNNVNNTFAPIYLEKTDSPNELVFNSNSPFTGFVCKLIDNQLYFTDKETKGVPVMNGIINYVFNFKPCEIHNQTFETSINIEGEYIDAQGISYPLTDYFEVKFTRQ